MSRIPKQLAEQILSLRGEQFFSADQALLDSMRQAACQHKLEGLAIACPDTVRDSRFPVVLLNARRTSRNKQVGGKLNYLLLVSPLGQGQVNVVPYFEPGPVNKNPRPRKPPVPPPWPAPRAGEATLTGVVLEQAGRRLSLPPRGAVAVRVLAWDWVSNTSLVQLEREPEMPGEGWRHHLDEARALHLRVVAAAESGAALRHGPGPDSPRLEGPGAALALAQQWPADDDSLMVHGTVGQKIDVGNLVLERWRVPPDPAQAPPAAAELPRAMINAALIVVRHADIDAEQVELTIPIYSAEPLQPGQPVQGSFSLDLARVLPRIPGPCMVWLVAGEQLAGPCPLLVQ